MARAGRLTLTFSLLGGAERAQNVLHFIAEDTYEASAIKTQLEGYISTLWGGIRGNYHSSTKMAGARLDRLDPATGRAISGVDLVVPATTGTAVGGPLPPQYAHVVSLRTDTAGRSFRGRMYLPAFSVSTMGTDGLTQQQPITEAINSVETFFEAINALTNVASVAVYSRRLAGFAPVTSIDMGSVVDTQRGRRNKLVESRQVRTL